MACLRQISLGTDIYLENNCLVIINSLKSPQVLSTHHSTNPALVSTNQRRTKFLVQYVWF